MSRLSYKCYFSLCWLWIAAFAQNHVLGLLDGNGIGHAEWTLEQVVPEQGVAGIRARSLAQSDIITIKGLPGRFSIRPMIDPSLCVHRANLASKTVTSARAASGLPATSAEELAEYGTSRLILLPCANGKSDTFLAETIIGRFYGNSGTNYRQGFLKPPSDNSICVYGVNTSYTNGHPVFGVTGTQYYNNQPDSTTNDPTDPAGGVTDMDWLDDYAFDYAPYIRYGYDPTTMVTNGTFLSPNPLPSTMLDASGWGPFPSTWGPCMPNPTLDTAVPTVDPATEMELRFHAWSFVGVPDTAATAHLPQTQRRNGYALVTLGPDRPQPDMSPLAGQVDAGNLSASLGGLDRPYGNGYSALVSKELCMTVEGVKAGAQIRLAPCNPALPSLQQIFQVLSRAQAKTLEAASH